MVACQALKPKTLSFFSSIGKERFGQTWWARTDIRNTGQLRTFALVPAFR
jgi:hypothetical protein